MITHPINLVPVQGRMNVIQSMIFNLNMRIMSLARQQLTATNKDNDLFAAPTEGTFDEESTFASVGGTFQFGQHIDGANALAERDRSSEDSAQVRHEQGHDEVPDPRKQAEPFISLRDMLYMKYMHEANLTRRRPLDQSFASIINWMHERDFTPNNAEAQAVWAASRGRVSIEQALVAQKKRHEQEKQRLAKIAEPLLAQMENFGGMDLGDLLATDTPRSVDGDVVIDTIFMNMAPLTRLGLVNVAWRRCHKLVIEDFPSKRMPTQDFAGDIALAINAEDEFLAVAKKLFDDAHDDYKARMTSGLPAYDVVNEIERLKKSAAAASAAPLAKPGQRAA
jgi:hypothetical protein